MRQVRFKPALADGTDTGWFVGHTIGHTCLIRAANGSNILRHEDDVTLLALGANEIRK